MQTLRECIAEAKAKKVAIGHFNVSTIEMFWAVVNAGKSLGVPVIVGVSEGERDFIGVKQIVALVKSAREELGTRIYVNADHTYSFERVKETIDAGFDSVIFDGAKLSFEENIRATKQCVDYARSAGSAILIEGEVGYIGQSSQVYDSLPEGAALKEKDLTTVEQAKKFVSETGADLFSPAIGSVHGMLRGGHDPDLNIGRIKEISDAVRSPLVLHGGSGLTDENFTKAIEGGIAIIHISTELRVAWKSALKLFLTENADEAAPYKILRPAGQEVQKVVENKLKIFNNI